MRHSLLLLLLMLTASAAQGQPAQGRTEVKQVLREALTVQVLQPSSLPRLPESADEPARAVAPEAKRAPAPATQLSREILERAGRMATRAASVPGDPTRVGAATAGAAADSRAAAGREQAETVRQQRPPRPGTPGSAPQPPQPPSPPIPPVESPSTPTPAPPSGTPGSTGP